MTYGEGFYNTPSNVESVVPTRVADKAANLCPHLRLLPILVYS